MAPLPQDGSGSDPWGPLVSRLWPPGFVQLSSSPLRRPGLPGILPLSSWFRRYQFLRNGLWPGSPSKWCFADVSEEGQNTGGVSSLLGALSDTACVKVTPGRESSELSALLDLSTLRTQLLFKSVLQCPYLYPPALQVCSSVSLPLSSFTYGLFLMSLEA